MVHTIHFPESAFAWTHAADSPDLSPESKLDSYAVEDKPWKRRWRCRSCGACIASANSKTASRSVWGAQLARDVDGRIIGWDTVKPTAHIFYGTRMMDIEDGIDKWEGYAGNSKLLDVK